MRSFLQRLSSRKFLAALAVQVASVAALFYPRQESTITAAAVRIAALVTLLLAALGYGKIEAMVDRQKGADRAESDSGPAGIR